MNDLTQRESGAPLASAGRVVVRASALPVSCPPKGVNVVMMHPRVFLKLESVGDVDRCPYCGQEYGLVA